MTETRNSEQLYTISELAGITGVSRRTIHYYVKERLLPPPTGRGQGAHYGEEHRLKLVLIGLLKGSTPFRLEGIREFIAPMSLKELRKEIRRLGDRISETPDAYAPVRAMYFSADLTDASRDGEASSTLDEPGPPRFVHSELRRLVAEAAHRSRSDARNEDGGKVDVEGESWHRVRITDDVEIHYRGADEGVVRKMCRLVTHARKLFRR